MIKKIIIIKKLSHLIEYFFLIFAGTIFRFLPIKAIYFIVRFFAVTAFDIFGYRRKVTLDNLNNAIGKKYSASDINKIARSDYINIGMTFAEMLYIPEQKAGILTMMDTEIPEVMSRALKSGKGVVFVSAHFGSWEMVGAYISAVGFRFSAIAKKQANPFSDNMINKKRNKLGIKVLSHKTGVRTLISELKAGGAIGLISDQNAGRNGVFVDFFGRKASTPQGAAQLAIKFNLPLIVILLYRTTPGRYACFAQNINIEAEDTVFSLTQKYTSVIEKVISEHPEQYFWMHRRWKTLSTSGRKTGTGFVTSEAQL